MTGKLSTKRHLDLKITIEAKEYKMNKYSTHESTVDKTATED